MYEYEKDCGSDRERRQRRLRHLCRRRQRTRCGLWADRGRSPDRLRGRHGRAGRVHEGTDRQLPRVEGRPGGVPLRPDRLFPGLPLHKRLRVCQERRHQPLADAQVQERAGRRRRETEEPDTVQADRNRTKNGKGKVRLTIRTRLIEH